MFALSKESQDKLDLVHKELARVVEEAIKTTPIDFKVGDGLRTEAEQRREIAEGNSKTMNSRHLTGHAVDLLALSKRAVSWNWDFYYPIADAMQKAANKLEVPIIWGGVWDRKLNQLGEKKPEVEAYKARRLALYPHKKVFIDGPHFELDREYYP